MSNISNINTDDMVTAATVFKESFEACINNLTVDARDLATRFTAELVLQVKPYLLVTPDGVERIVDMVFGHESNRDFILSLTFSFFSRLGQDEDFVKGLAGNLSRGAALGKRGDLCAIPEAIKGRFSEMNDVHNLLEANYWLMTVLMLQLFITINLDQPKK